MTVLIALVSSLMWGTADFCGGTAARRWPTAQVVVVSQAAGLATALVVAAFARSFGDPAGYLGWAIASGCAGAIALSLFYRALAIGTMGVVAPIAATGVAIPVVIGLFGGHSPSAVTLAGMALAVIGLLTASGPERVRPDPDQVRSMVFALGAAVGFGLTLYGIARGSKFSPTMTMVGMRGSSVPLLGLALLIGRSRGPRTQRRPASTGLLFLVVVTGVLDVGANLLFGLASTRGTLAVVAVLGSLYPVATVVLARIIDGERMTRWQNVGVAAAIAGVALIAAGG